MILKRITIFLLTAIMISGMLGITGLAVPEPRITIDVSNKADEDVTVVSIDDIIKVTVSLSDFTSLSMTSPSIHFNPDVLSVCDIDGNILTTAYEDTTFYQAGNAITSGWNGSIKTTENYYPFFNNETGVIGMFADNLSNDSLVGKQSIYSVYLKVIGLGDADIRLSRKEDSAGKTDPLKYYDYAMYLGDTPNYVIYSGEGLKMDSLPGITAVPTSDTIYTTVKAAGTNDTWCYINDKFEVKVYVKNTQSLMAIHLPILYDLLPGTAKAVMLDLNGDVVTPLTKADEILDINPKFAMLTNGKYPKFDLENKFAKILLEVNTNTTPSGILKPSAIEPTWLCTINFKALDVGKYEQSADLKAGFVRFATDADSKHDEMSPTGAIIVDENALNPEDTNIIIFPKQQNAPFEIRREKSKAPEKVAVIPNNDNTATVIVTGVAPGASVTLYDTETGAGIRTAPADANGNVVFAYVPLSGTTDDRIYADAIEPQKSISDQNSGIPGVPPVEKVLVSLEPYETISVDYGTEKGNIPLPTTKIKGKVGYVVDGYAGVFVLPDDVLFDPIPTTWTNTNYDGSVSATYDFFVSPDLTGTGLTNPNNLTAKQPVYVKPYISGPGPGSGPSGSGGGTRVVTPPTSKLIINCINEEDEIIYTQTVLNVEVGKEQSINAPDLEAYTLAFDEETPKTVKILSSDTIVEFRYVKKAELNKADHYKYILGYPDGSVQPEGDITREEVASIFYRLLTKASRKQYRTKESTFPDVSWDRWSSEGIATIQKARIIEGRDNGGFDPSAKITRAEFATMAVRFEKLSENAEHGFSDVSGHWSEKYIISAVSRGWVNGYPDNTFKPDQPITRTEAMTLINRVLERNVDLEGLKDDLKIDWPDLPITHWGYFDVQEATVSHNFERRFPEEFETDKSKLQENWTTLGEDVDFELDE